jgi:hypothetical protein
MVIVWSNNQTKKFTATARKLDGARLKDVEEWAFSKGLQKTYSKSHTNKSAADADKRIQVGQYLNSGYSELIRGNI